jgi:hypothetical protein
LLSNEFRRVRASVLLLAISLAATLLVDDNSLIAWAFLSGGICICLAALGLPASLQKAKGSWQGGLASLCLGSTLWIFSWVLFWALEEALSLSTGDLSIQVDFMEGLAALFGPFLPVFFLLLLLGVSLVFGTLRLFPLAETETKP